MKVTTEYNLNDPDDAALYELHLDAEMLAIAVDDISRIMRAWLKYDTMTAENFRDEAEKLREALCNALSTTRGTYV